MFSGRLMNKKLGYIHFWVTAIGSYGIFFPMHFVGLAGLPRRYYTNSNFPYFDDLQDVNVVVTLFAIFAIAGQDGKRTRLNSSHVRISYAVFCLKQKRSSLTIFTSHVRY